MAEELVPDYNDGLPLRPATHHHSALVLGAHIYLFGGQCAPDARGFSAIDSDVWSFNLERRSWRRMEVAGGVSRHRGRTRHSAVGYKGSMFVYGGNQIGRGGKLMMYFTNQGEPRGRCYTFYRLLNTISQMS